MLKVWILFFLSGTAVCFGQANRATFNVGLEYNQQDFFLNAGYTKQLKRFELGAAVGVGVNRTFFQQRIFPKMQLQGTYQVVQSEMFRIGPSFAVHYGGLNVNASSSKLTYYQFYGAGYQLVVGKRFQGFQSTHFCRMTEYFFDTFEGRYTPASSWIFSIQLGGRYAF
ncbi:MAG: hypothetical protein E6Q37_03860 [Crocinitomicaceae bacterium]|nr:MAG: hypothetical protein E6Q37_03860 [Crocinitomicaceae bacterium]